jgi:sulfite exporter TauE/SafE
MSMLQQIGNPYLASLVIGLFYGLTFCTSACLPYITSYIAGIKAGFRKGVIITSIYNIGRITAYALLGVVTGLFRMFMSDTFFFAYQKYALVAFGITIIVIGTSLLLGKKASSHTCNNRQAQFNMSKQLIQKFDFRAFSMGFTRGLIVCPPLVALLLYSVTLSVPSDSVVLAILFGLGTAFSPLLILGGATGWLLNKAPIFRGWITKISAGILILLGFQMILSALIQL